MSYVGLVEQERAKGDNLMLYPGENPIDSNPLAQLALIIIVISFIWFWSKCPRELQRFIGLIILVGCIFMGAFVLMANVPH